MHIPDGFIDAPTSVAFGVVAAAGIGYCLRRGSAELDDRAAPLAGLTAAFVFAAQMLNFPVAAGTSGHLLGGVLAAVLVGPWIGATCLAVVLLLQGLFFADGGITALGLNVTNMSLLGALGGYLLFRVVLRLLPQRRTSVPVAAAVAAGLSVPIAAAGFVLQFAIGGTVEDLSLRAVLAAMVGVHVLIGLGEATITFLTVGLVLRSRPDLVHGARGLLRRESARSAPAPVVPAVPAARP
jgi:cobalt/nickel transport system permease protein